MRPVEADGSLRAEQASSGRVGLGLAEQSESWFVIVRHACRIGQNRARSWRWISLHFNAHRFAVEHGLVYAVEVANIGALLTMPDDLSG